MKIGDGYLGEALDTADRLGVRVVPIRGKRPIAEHGYASASRDPATIEKLFAAAADATGFGIAAGDDLVIVDVAPPPTRPTSWPK